MHQFRFRVDWLVRESYHEKEIRPAGEYRLKIEKLLYASDMKDNWKLLLVDDEQDIREVTS
ncbi:MAG: hypothetical protein ACQETC_08405, partial [Thermodesulfobacteriota bacterium]